MSAGTPVAMRMVHSCCSRPHWYMDFWQLAVAPGEFTGDTMTRTNWEQSILHNFSITISHCSACWICNEVKATGRHDCSALPAAWGGGWWPSVQTSQSYHHQPQTRASFSECKSPPWRSSDWSCCSLAGWAAAANSPPPQYLHRGTRIYITTLQYYYYYYHYYLKIILPPSLLPSSVIISRRRSNAFSNATIFWMAALLLVSCWSSSKPCWIWKTDHHTSPVVIKRTV